MRLDIKSALVGVVVGAALATLVGVQANPAGAQGVVYDHSPQLGGDDFPSFQSTIGPDGDVYVTYTRNGETRRVFQQNGAWVSEIVAPDWGVYRKRVVTTPQARSGR